ncbi:membrane associated rhomboid family serine protease [Nocardia puris]|uniref:Membrane associated rhomboid family serine protease n=1 Tax=Nocardia puris TaxID=208602 RepID=A0A366DNL4_9NOCA|nr:membrane associated rhomboid family serine protease [Nocardia puris]
MRPVRTVAGAPVAKSATPLVTYGLIALNILFFGITAAQAGSVVDNFRSELFLRWALVPTLVADGEWFRVIGSGFLHWGPLHLALNMFALYIVGIQLEPVLGRVRMLSIYLVSLIGGSAAGLLLEPVNTVGAGASGAVYGMFGAIAVTMFRLRMNPTQILVIIGINVLLSLSIPGVSLWVHLGGLLAGTSATLGVLFVPQWVGAKSQESARTIGWVSIGVVGLASAAAIAAAAMMIG